MALFEPEFSDYFTYSASGPQFIDKLVKFAQLTLAVVDKGLFLGSPLRQIQNQKTAWRGKFQSEFYLVRYFSDINSDFNAVDRS